MKQELYISHANSASTAVAKRFGGLLLNSSKGREFTLEIICLILEHNNAIPRCHVSFLEIFALMPVF